MEQPDAAAATAAAAAAAAQRRKFEAFVRRMKEMERMILRHQKLPPAGTKRSQPEAPSLPPLPSLSWLLTIDDRRAEINARADRIYEDVMRNLDEILAESSAGDVEERHEMMEG